MYSKFNFKGNQFMSYFVLAIVLYGNALLAGSYGFINQSIPTLKSMNKMTDSQISWIGSLANLGLPIGSILCSFGMNWIGRKYTALFFTCGTFICGRLFYLAASLLDPISQSSNIFILMCIGRILEGMAQGSCSCLNTIYAFELSCTDSQNKLASVMLCGTGYISTFFVFVVGGFVNWKVLNLSLFAIVLPYALLLAIFVPESPYFYIKKNNHTKAFESVSIMLGNNADKAHIHLEVLTKRLTSTKDKENTSSFHLLKSLSQKEVFKPFLIGIVTIFLYQFAGFNVLSNFSETIADSHYTSVGMMGAGVVGALSSIILVRLITRTTLLAVCSFGCAVMFFILTAGLELELPSWILISTLVLFNIGFAAGYAAVCFPFIAQLQSNDFRPVAMAILLALGGGFAFVNTKTFFNLNELFSGKKQWTFAIYGSLNLFTTVWALLVMRKYEVNNSAPDKDKQVSDL